MAKDKYTAVWVSHSSISDFLACPRAYFLNNVYKDPKTGHKISLISPPLALGQAVHEVIESLSVLPTDQRFKQPLTSKLQTAWKKISGKKGGFIGTTHEQVYKDRALTMLKRVKDNPGPLKNLAVKINMNLPHFWLSEEENIILCGKIDWLQYFPDTDSVHIIDFKTGKAAEKSDSLQLPIYHLLVDNCQKHPVDKASYWYIQRDDKPIEKPLPNLNQARKKVLKIAKEIKLARQLNRFKCPQQSDCYACKPLEAILRGEAEFVGVNDFKQDIYVITDDKPRPKSSSVL